jgi:hypothetical protein
MTRPKHDTADLNEDNACWSGYHIERFYGVLVRHPRLVPFYFTWLEKGESDRRSVPDLSSICPRL